MNRVRIKDRLMPAIRSRASWPKVLLGAIIALGIGVSVGWSLPVVPDTILLPDSLGPLRPPYHLAFGGSSWNIYVASESSDIIVVEGSTFQRIKRINSGTPVGGARLVAQHEKLYCSYPMQGRIGVIDCVTNSIIRTIQVGTRPTLLCYSTGSDKLYCGDTIDGTVSVIDCAADTVCKVISVGRSLTAMTYDPTTCKMYAATGDALLTISCSTDSIVASIDEIKAPMSLCVNKRRQKLYVTRQYIDTVYAISTQADSVIARMKWGTAGLLACNEATDRLYGVCSQKIAEFDCLGDTCTRSTYFTYDYKAMACDSVHNRLYFLGQSDFMGFDCLTWQWTSQNPLGRSAAILEVDPARFRVMCAGGRGDRCEDRQLRVFDYKSDTVLARGAVPLCGWAGAMYHNPATGKLYCQWDCGLGVVDEQTNHVVDQVFLPDGGGKLIHSRTSGKFYFQVTYGSPARRGLGVLDGTKDSLLKVIELGDAYADAFPCWCPDGDKVYAFATTGARYYIAVVDCKPDSVVRTIDVYDRVKGFEYLGESRMLCNLRECLTLIDCRTDSILVDSTTIGAVYALAHTGDGQKVYMVRRDPGRLEVRSSSTLSLLATIDWPYYTGWNMGTFLTYSDTTRKLYWFVRDSVLAIDATGDTVTTRVTTDVRCDRACLDHTGRYLFCSSSWTGMDSCLRVYDTQSDSLVGVYPHLPKIASITAAPERHRIYVGCQDVVLVYSDAPPGVEEAAQSRTRRKLAGPTIVSRNSPLVVHQPSALLDAVGRKVLDAEPGLNSLSGHRSGVYFLHNCSDGKVVKILLVD